MIFNFHFLSYKLGGYHIPLSTIAFHDISLLSKNNALYLAFLPFLRIFAATTRQNSRKTNH